MSPHVVVVDVLAENLCQDHQAIGAQAFTKIGRHQPKKENKGQLGHSQARCCDLTLVHVHTPRDPHPTNHTSWKTQIEQGSYIKGHAMSNDPLSRIRICMTLGLFVRNAFNGVIC